MAMELSEYIDQKTAAATKKGEIKVPVDILERWESRIVARGLHKMGAKGANQYLSDYGKGIAAPKVVNLAIKADQEGYFEMAGEFWRRAYQLEMHELAPETREVIDLQTMSLQKVVVPGTILAEVGSIYSEAMATGLPVHRTEPYAGSLPIHLRPGRILTMQPVDAPLPREHYITSDQYWGQPKRDGNRLVIVADDDGISYQSRSTKLRPGPSQEIHDGLFQTYQRIGPYILDGELWYPDFEGGEHRTGSQAGTFNIDNGHPFAPVVARYAIFKALYADKEDLTRHSEVDRINWGVVIGDYLKAMNDQVFEVLPTAKTTYQKRGLAALQVKEGREGEVWVSRDCIYKGGKDTKHYPIVRTKYILEIDALVTGLTPTTAEHRLFGAIEVSDINGHPLGAVGTGFSFEDQLEIQHLFGKGRLVIKVGTQGFTETHQLQHGRFLEIV
jgi:hypothetical protein